MTSGTKSTTMWTPMTTLTTGRHSTSTITWRFTICTSTNSSTERAHVVLFLAHFITLTLAQEWVLSAPSLHPSAWPSTWAFSLHVGPLHSTSQPSSCSFSSSPSSTSATSSSRSSTRRSWKTCATPRPTVVWGYLRRPLPHHRLWAQRPRLQRAPELIGPPLLQDPSRGPGRGWPDTRRDAHWSIPRQVDYSVREGVSVSQLSSSVRFDRSGQLDGEMVDRGGQPDECNSSKARIRTLLEEQGQTILAECHAIVSHHELQAAQAEEERRLFQGQLWQQKLEFREAHQRSLTEMQELRKFQSFAFDTVARRIFIEDQKTILELSGRVQELQNGVNCMTNSKDFQDAESIFSGNSHVLPVDQCHSHLIQYLKGCWGILSLRRAAEKGRQAFGTHGVSGNVFVNPDASSSAPYPQELHQWNSSVEEPLHSSTVEKSERPEQNQDLRCQSGPSAKDSVILSGGDSSNNYGADQQRLQISDLHFDKFPTPATFACRKIRFKTEVCACSKFLTEALQWIKEVEMVVSMDDLRSSSSTRSISIPNFEVLMFGLLQRWTKSSIILTSKEESVWKNKRPRSRTVSSAAGRLLTWSTNTSGSLEPMILSRTMPTYSLSVY